MEDAAHIIKDGLNQIFFVTNGRFTKEQVSTYKLLQETIFDENVGKYTTIVRTNFPDFSSWKECEKDQKLLLVQNKELSETIESCNSFIYVDNPPIPTIDEEDNERTKRKKERRTLENKEDREESRNKLLNHLKKCNKIYEPEFLSKFHKAIEEFNLIENKVRKSINEINYWFNKNIEQLEKFISEREKIIKLIEERKTNVDELMLNRFVGNTITHASALAGKSLLVSGIWFPPALVPGAILTAGSWLGNATSETLSIINEKKLYDTFEGSLNKDKKNREDLENSQVELKRSTETFKEVYLLFDKSEYKKQVINRKKIEEIDKSMGWLFVNENKRIEPKKTENLSHSATWKVGRAIAEAAIRTVPSPICFYLVYRDHKEIEKRTSLNDMEAIIKNWREDLEKWKEKLSEDQEIYKNFESRIMIDNEEREEMEAKIEVFPKTENFQ